MLEPRKRTALDGKTWWCVFDTENQTWSTLTIFGKYSTRKACQLDIDLYQKGRHVIPMKIGNLDETFTLEYR